MIRVTSIGKNQGAPALHTIVQTACHIAIWFKFGRYRSFKPARSFILLLIHSFSGTKGLPRTVTIVHPFRSRSTDRPVLQPHRNDSLDLLIAHRITGQNLSSHLWYILLRRGTMSGTGSHWLLMEGDQYCSLNTRAPFMYPQKGPLGIVI